MIMLPSRFFLDNMVDDFFAKDENRMKCDIYEKDNTYHVEMDLPGFNKEDIKVELNNGNLTISAEKSDDKEEKDEDKKYIRRERTYGKFSRSFYLGDVNEDAIDASFNNGTLTISIPKIDEDKAKKYIDIK